MAAAAAEDPAGRISPAHWRAMHLDIADAYLCPIVSVFRPSFSSCLVCAALRQVIPPCMKQCVVQQILGSQEIGRY